MELVYLHDTSICKVAGHVGWDLSHHICIDNINIDLHEKYYQVVWYSYFSSFFKGAKLVMQRGSYLEKANPYFQC